MGPPIILHTDNYKGTIKNIIHISDIHIRHGNIEQSRYTEYKHVLNDFIQNITIYKKLSIQNNDTLLVITGDVFHNKGKMDTPAIKLYFQWMDKLLQIAPVIIICGNHDYRQEDPSHPDMIEVLSVPYKNTEKYNFPLIYLKETGHYIWNNIGFGIVSVKDTLRIFNTSGLLSKLPEFPSPNVFSQSIDFKIALFHGSLLPYNTKELQNIHGYRLEWFQGYDAVLLGDNHKQQIHRNTLCDKEICWGYPGSLLQQNFGEIPLGHGYILWNFHENKIEMTCHHILNNYGLITVKKAKDTDTYNAFLAKQSIPLEEAILHDMFPKHPRIRIIGTTGEDRIVKALFEEHNIQISSIMVTIPINEKDDGLENDIDHETNIHDKIEQMVDINHTDKWIQFIQNSLNDNYDDDTQNHICEIIRNPQSLLIEYESIDSLPKDIHQKIKTRNTKISKAIDEYTDIRMQHHGKNHKIIFKHIAWDYVMCYGQGNYFDFENLTHKICLLNGRNAIGKSAFLDVLCIGLYGEPSKQRHMLTGKKMTGKMIHDHRPPNVSMYVAILFTLNDTLYEVYRSFSQQAKEENWARAIQATICTVDISNTEGNPPTKTVICEGTVMVDEWIYTHFGSLDDILMSTFVSQIETNNFFHMKQDEQKTILDKALHLESIAAFASILKESILAHDDIIRSMNSSKATIEEIIQTGTKNNIKDPNILHENIDKYTINLQELQKNYNKLTILIGEPCENDKFSDTMSSLKKQLEKFKKKLSDLPIITDDDKKQALMIQGEQKAGYMALRKELDEIGEPTMIDVSIAHVYQQIKELEETIIQVLNEKPVCHLSKEILTKKLNDLEIWTQCQKPEWFENPDDLDMYIEHSRELLIKTHDKYTQYLENNPSKPSSIVNEETQKLYAEFVATKKKWTLKDVHALQETFETLQNDRIQLITSQIIPCRNKNGFEKWTHEYHQWCDKVSPIVNDSEYDNIDEMNERYKQHITYIQAIEAKESEKNSIEKDLIDINDELNDLSIDKIPFNPECFACKQQPMRKRHDSLSVQKNKLHTVHQKILKYLKKIGEVDLTFEKEQAAELQTLIHLKIFYDETKNDKESEQAMWLQASHEWTLVKDLEKKLNMCDKNINDIKSKLLIIQSIVWEQWQNKERTLKKQCDDLKNEIDAGNIFIKEYTDYVNEQRFLNDENDVHEKYIVWEEKYASLKDSLDKYVIEKKCKELEEKFNTWQQSNCMRVDLVEQIRLYETLEKDIFRVQRMMHILEMNKMSEDKKDIDNKIEVAKLNLIHYEKDVADLEKFQNILDKYNEFYTILIKRKDILILLENKFIGEKNGNDGFKEWVYKEHVIPLVENEINRFLSSIDTIRLKIIYHNKAFQYMVIDRGNTPTLAMSSGYQRFIIGISLRLAFACIGATGQNIRHLFIDEGFVACDTFNLEKVQFMLRKMMDYAGYENIILMSHLDAIRDAADISIDIMRHDLFSSVKWGNSYPKLIKKTQEMSEVKRRGRPTKK
jgi:DNA repair exonuclease SbcCD ATPase subunit